MTTTVALGQTPTRCDVEPLRQSSVALRILLVDESETAVTLAQLLGIHGHHVQIAAASLAAIESTDTAQPAVVLLELGAPGSDARMLATQFQNAPGRKRPFLIGMVSAEAACEHSCSPESGVHFELAKPLDLILLIKILRRLQTVLLPRNDEDEPLPMLPDSQVA